MVTGRVVSTRWELEGMAQGGLLELVGEPHLTAASIRLSAEQMAGRVEVRLETPVRAMRVKRETWPTQQAGPEAEEQGRGAREEQ